MKKVFYLILGVLVIISCSKESPLKNSEDNVNSVYYPTGLIPLTDAQIAIIPNTDSIDIIVLPSFSKGSIDSVSIEVPPPGSQGKISSCTAWAVAYGMLGYQYHVIRGYSDYNSPEKLFSPSYIYNQLSPDDKGINIKDAFDQIKKQGCCTSDFMDLSAKVNVLPTSDAKVNAANYKISDYYKFEDINIEKIKAYLVKGYPIVFACTVDKEFTKYKSTQAFEIQTDGRKIWKKYTDDIAGNHSMLLCGYDNSINAFKVLNSWGQDFGNNGFFWIDYDWFKTVVCKTIIFNYPEIFVGVVKRPIITTSEITEIKANSATGGGRIISDWGYALTSSGICWSITQNPIISNNQTSTEVGIGEFQSKLTNLNLNTTYFVKAYATNIYGTAYGKQVSFKTNSTASIPIVTTSEITSITQTSAIGGGNISSDGGAVITDRGICWSTSANPTIANNRTKDGIGSGNFISNLIGLTTNTLYYVRAYATNSVGTSYGDQLSFTTQGNPSPNINNTTWDVTIFFNSTTSWHADITFYSDGTMKYDEPASPGVYLTYGVWSQNEDKIHWTQPYIFDGTINGNTMGGTFVYGGETKTWSAIPLESSNTDLDGNVYTPISIGNQIWMKENLRTTKYNDGSDIPLVTDNYTWWNLTTPGICWYNNDPGTYKTSYGAMYNWYSVDMNSNGGKNVCPVGWHVPTDTEWNTLITYLGGETNAGGKLKEVGTTHWLLPNTGASNESGFTGLPGGRRDTPGSCVLLGINGDWWSSTENYGTSAFFMDLYSGGNNVGIGSNYKLNGYSVRCLKDN